MIPYSLLKTRRESMLSRSVQLGQFSEIEFTKQCNQKIFQYLNLPLYENHGCTYGVSGSPSPFLNGVIGSSLADADVSVAVRDISQFYHKNELLHSWWMEVSTEPSSLKDHLEKNGLKIVGAYPGMFLTVNECVQPKSTEGLIIETVVQERDLNEWSHVIKNAFGFSESFTEHYASLFQAAGYKGSFCHLVGKIKGKVVSTGTILFAEHGAYIYNAGTLEGEKKKGCCSNMIYALIQLAKANNYSQVALTSSPLAVSLYQKLGFRQVCKYHIYA